MKDTNRDYLAIWYLVGGYLTVVGLGILAIVLFSCNPFKKFQGYTKDVYDSLYVVELEEKVKVLEIENGELTSRVNELEFLGVTFDNNCDSVLKTALLKAGCNTDSINAILNMYRSRIKTFADGTVEAEGFIKSLRRSKERNEETIAKYQREIDSLKEVKQKQIHWQQTVTITKTVTKKKGINWWLWVLIGYGICVVLPPQRIWQYIKIGVTRLPFKK